MSLVAGKSKTNIQATVGLCVKNSENTVKEAIESILNQKYPKELMQMIVVDGCSKDKTLSIITSVTSKTDMRVEIYSDEGRGLGAARQIVVDNADGRYIVFVDGDVELLNDFVQKQVEFMEQNPKVGIAIGRYMYKEEPSASAFWNLTNHVTEFVSSCQVCRFEALRQVGGFDENIKGASEDRDLTVRIQAKGWILSSNEKARFYHNCRENFRDFWVKQTWYGYGNHYFRHKHKHLDPLWRNVPLGSFIHGLKLALKAYESTHQKLFFLIPLQMVFGNIAWWFGFIKGHMDGYGHEIS